MHQPGCSTTGGRPGRRILTEGINAASAQRHLLVPCVAGHIVEICRGRFLGEICFDFREPRLQALQHIEAIEQYDNERQTRRNTLYRRGVTNVRWSDTQKTGDDGAIVDFPEDRIELLHLAIQFSLHASKGHRNLPNLQI